MSVEQLVLTNEDVSLKIRRTSDATNESYNIEVYEPNHWIDLILDRNQAHLLKLWLEEHLK